MKNLTSMQFHKGTREEFLEDMQPEFPYASLRTELTKYQGRFIPWHWHKQAVEFFWIEKGEVECLTPYQRFVLKEGTGGFVNVNVMHMRRCLSKSGAVVQYLHIFEPSLIAVPGSRIEKKYVLPLVTRKDLDVVTLDPESASDMAIIEQIREAGFLKEGFFGYEVRLREHLTRIWMLLLEKVLSSEPTEVKNRHRNDEKLKLMIAFIYEHFAERITIADIARSAYLSERASFRLFKEILQTTPMDYLRSYRIRKATEMLASSPHLDLSQIAFACGFQSGSYFGQVFKSAMGCSPSDFRSNLAEF